MDLLVTDDPSAADQQAIGAALAAFNQERAGPPAWRRLAVLIRNEEGATIGGLWGVTSYGWLFVEMLFVPEELRGKRTGGRILSEAETEARGRSCRNVWLDTFSFQARGFTSAAAMWSLPGSSSIRTITAASSCEKRSRRFQDLPKARGSKRGSAPARASAP